MNYAVVGNSLISCRGEDSVLTLPDNVVKIDANAFDNVRETAECIILPPGFTSIPKYMFASCDNLREVIFSHELVSVGSRAFYGCSLLKNVILPEGVKSIGSEAFRFCRGLSRVLLPSGISDIGEDAFASYCKMHLEVSMDTFLRFSQSIFAFDDFESLKITNSGETVLLLYFPCCDKNPHIENSFRSCLTANEDTFTVDYELYDSFFSRIKYSEYKCNIALHRLIFPEKLSPEMKRVYKTYLKFNGRKAAEVLRNSDSFFSESDLNAAGIYFNKRNEKSDSSDT